MTALLTLLLIAAVAAGVPYVFLVINAREESPDVPLRNILVSEAAGMAATVRDWCRRAAAFVTRREPAAALPTPSPAGTPPPPAPQRPAPAPMAAPVLGDLTASLPAQGGPVPPDWAAVVARISTFEPADDADLLGFMRSEAAALPALADAWRGLADTQLHVIGIDPAAVQGSLELADVLGDCAHDVVLAMRKFLVTYAEVQAAIAGGLILPHKAREFLTGAGS